MENPQIEQLKKLIRLELSECNAEKWPNTCALQSTSEGYARVEAMIIRHVAKEGMPIGSAIAFIEQELTHQIH